MARILALAVPGLLVASVAQADDCADRLSALLVDRTEKGPVTIHVTQEIKGSPPSRNITRRIAHGHWMTEMVEPATMPWSLAFDGALYASFDRGESWSKLRDLEPAEKALPDTNAPVPDLTDVHCGSETIDGIAYETVSGSYAVSGMEIGQTFWINPTSSWVARSVMRLRQADFESVTTQVIEPAPGLGLPTPR